MPDPINFVATSDGHAYFGIAADPAAIVAEMRPHCPLPIELAAGWSLAPSERGAVLAAVTKELRNTRVSSGWFKVSPERALAVLKKHAEYAGGQVWRVRKRPVTEQAAHPASRPIITPYGQFPSAAAAATAIGITRAAVSDRAKRRSPGWRYADDDRPQPPPGQPGRPTGWRKYPAAAEG